MKKRWYLLLIAAGLLLCAVPLQFPQHLPKPVFALLAAGGSVLVGGSLGSLLCQVIRIRDPVLVQAYKEQHDERNTMICEKAAARAARVMQGAVLYRRGLCPLSGAAHVDHLGAGWVLPRLGASGMGPHPLVPAQDVAKQDPGKQPGSCWSAAHLQQLLMSSQLSGRLTVLGGTYSPPGKEMFRNRAQGSSQPSPQAHSLSGIQ